MLLWEKLHFTVLIPFTVGFYLAGMKVMAHGQPFFPYFSHFLHRFYKNSSSSTAKAGFFHLPCLLHRNTKILYSRLMVWGSPFTRVAVRFTSQWPISDHRSGNAFASLKPPAQSALHGSASNPKQQLRKCFWPPGLLAFKVSNMSKTQKYIHYIRFFSIETKQTNKHTTETQLSFCTFQLLNTSHFDFHYPFFLLPSQGKISITLTPKQKEQQSLAPSESFSVSVQGVKHYPTFSPT